MVFNGFKELKRSIIFHLQLNVYVVEFNLCPVDVDNFGINCRIESLSFTFIVL